MNLDNEKDRYKREMESLRKQWNKRQSELRQLLLSGSQHPKAIKRLLSQHARLHSVKMVSTEDWSYEDDIFAGMAEEQVRRIPAREDHSVAWVIWHIARIEDVTMNLLVDDDRQIFHRGSWFERIGSEVQDTGNAVAREDVAALSDRVDIEALRAYRLAVGRRTREIVEGLRPEDLKQKVDPSRLGRVLDQGAVVEAAGGLIDYWGRRDIAGLLLMPATRHNFVHLNEALRIKQRLFRDHRSQWGT